AANAGRASAEASKSPPIRRDSIDRGSSGSGALSLSLLRSEIGLCRDRHMVVEEIEVVLGANVFEIWKLGPALVAYVSRPRLVEGLGIVDGDPDFECFPAVYEMPAFDHVQLFGMRRAEGIDHGFCVLSDRVHHQRIAFVMADRFSVPRGFGVGRMGYVQINVL